MSGGQAAGSRSAQQLGQIFQPPKQYLQFPSSRPPFVSPDEYHRFDGRRGGRDEMADALVIKTPVSFWWRFVGLFFILLMNWMIFLLVFFSCAIFFCLFGELVSVGFYIGMNWMFLL